MGDELLHQLPVGVSPQSFEALDHCLKNYEYLSTTLDGDGSVYAQTVEGPLHERIIIFLSPRMSRFMGQCREVFTSVQKIRAAPPNYHQDLYFYQISCILHESVISLMLAVMQSPTYEALRGILLYLKQSVPAFSPMIVNLPYCLKEKRVWEEVYHCVIQFTTTSYFKALVKKCFKLKLIHVMATECKLRPTLMSFLSIPLLPREMMHQGLVILSKRALLSAHNETVKRFLMYYCNTWMEGAWYETLSAFSHGNCQSNASDVAKRNLLKQTGSHYPNILHLINVIRDHERYSYVCSRRARSGLDVGRGQKVATLRNDAVIRRCTAQLVAGEMSIKRFLRVTSTRLMGVFRDCLCLRGLVV